MDLLPPVLNHEYSHLVPTISGTCSKGKTIQDVDLDFPVSKVPLVSRIAQYALIFVNEHTYQQSVPIGTCMPAELGRTRVI